MSVESVETCVNVGFLPLLSIVECDFFRVSEELVMQVAVLTFQLLFNSSHSSEGRGDGLDDQTRKTVPSEDHGGAFPSDEFSQLFAEEDDIEYWLGQVHVKAREGSSPFLCVSCKALIGVGDTAVQVADLVVVHALQVLRVEVQGQTLSESKGQLLLEVVEAGVDSGGGDSKHKKSHDSLDKSSEVFVDDSLHDHTVHVCQPDAQHSPQYQKNAQNH